MRRLSPGEQAFNAVLEDEDNTNSAPPSATFLKDCTEVAIPCIEPPKIVSHQWQ